MSKLLNKFAMAVLTLIIMYVCTDIHYESRLSGMQGRFYFSYELNIHI